MAVNTVDNGLYTWTATPTFAIAGEDYTDDDSVRNNPDWLSVDGTVVATPLQLLPDNDVLKWFENTNGIQNSLITPINSGYTDGTYEMHVVLATKTLNFGRLIFVTELFTQGSGGSESITLRYINGGTLDLQLTNDSTGTLTGPGAQFASDSVYYITLRHKRQTGPTNNDGIFEVWVNGQLALSMTDHNYNNTTTDSWNRKRTTLGVTSVHRMKNLTVLDTFTTAQGVQPPYIRVIDDGSPTTYDATVEAVNESYYIEPVISFQLADMGAAVSTVPLNNQFEFADGQFATAVVVPATFYQNQTITYTDYLRSPSFGLV